MTLLWLLPLLCGAAACSFDASTTNGLLDDGAPAPRTDGSPGQDSTQGGADSQVEDDAAIPVCQQFTAFSAPALIAEVSSSSLDNAPTLSPDELTMIIHSLRGGGQGGRDLWIATRPSLGSAFSTPTNMSTVNSSSDEFGPTLSADGLELFFGSSRTGGLGGYDLWRATRATTSASFEAPTHVPGVSSSDTDFFPVLSGDGLSLYFASDRSGGLGSYDTWVATRPNTASAFAAPSNLTDTNSGSTDEAIAVSSDQRHFFIQSRRNGSQGGYDVWMSTRAATAVPFPAASILTEVNSSSDDQATWLSLDGLRLYQSSTRDGSWNIYVSERGCAIAAN